MANLDITKLKKRDNIKTFAEKIFHINNKACTFHTSKGRLECTGYELQYPGESIEYETRGTNSSQNKKSAKILIENLTNAPTGTKLWLIGTWGKVKDQLVKISEITKTEEFGGQPGAGGKKVNKGNQFEEDLQNRLEECIGGKICKGKYNKQVQALLESVEKIYKLPVQKSVLMGGLNQPRPLTGTSTSSLHISPNSPIQHGKKLTDITLGLGKDGIKEVFLSLKFGGTLTFMNAGVGKVLTQSEIQKYNITNTQGLALLNLFGINETDFCHIFNGVHNKIKNHIDKKPNSDIKNIKRFLQTAIGAGYWMIHGHEGDKITMWEMTAEKTKKAANGISNPIVYYGGKSGIGKRIDVEFSSSYFDFKLNIRNKQSGVYPSHVMLDYKSKAALGKIEL
tara:strand:+ start:52 stop:1236 length:1185 start_codon:yes stop_codon:yes gene_type:complete